MGDARVDRRRRAPAALALVHRDVGVLEQRLRAVGVLGEERDADARLDVELGAGDRERLGRAAARAGRAASRAAASARLARRGRRSSSRNSSPPWRASRPRSPSAPRSRAGDAAQQPVAGAVPERVVDELEVVEVDEQQRDRALAPPRARDRGAHARLELRAVGEPGQRVEEREPAQLLLGPHVLGDVLAGQHHDHAALGVGQRGRLPGDAAAPPATRDDLRLVALDRLLAAADQALERLPRLRRGPRRGSPCRSSSRRSARRAGRRARRGRGG